MGSRMLLAEHATGAQQRCGKAVPRGQSRK